MDTPFEKLLYIKHVILKRVSEVFTYTNWSDEFATSYIRTIPDDLVNSKLDLKNIEINKFTNEECDFLGFGKWEKDNPMRLIPLWMLPFLPEQIKCSSINGEQIINKSDIDTDNRFGYLAYGIIPLDKH